MLLKRTLLWGLETDPSIFEDGLRKLGLHFNGLNSALAVLQQVLDAASSLAVSIAFTRADATLLKSLLIRDL